MDKTLRTASTGLSAQQRYIEIISNNLSNVNTTGYKKNRPEFQDLLYETIRPAGGNQRIGGEPLNEVQIGSGTQVIATNKQFSQGDIKTSNNPLDFAINGEGFFIVRMQDNTQAYTRNGSFQLDRNGQLTTAQGFVLEPGFTIPQDAVEVQITKDGVLRVILEGTLEEQTIGQLELARFINPAGLKAMGDNIFKETPASGRPFFDQPGFNNTGVIIQNAVETSNVDIVEEMVNMIMAQRAYELNSKSVRTADDVLGVAVNLKR